RTHCHIQPCFGHVDANKGKAYFQNSILLDDFIFPPTQLNLADDAGFDNPGNCSSFSGGRTGRPMLTCDLSIKRSSICPVLFRMNYVHTHQIKDTRERESKRKVIM